MEEQTGFNGFEPSDYANGLYEDAKVNCYYLAESQTITEFKIWTDFLLDDWTGDSDI